MFTQTKENGRVENLGFSKFYQAMKALNPSVILAKEERYGRLALVTSRAPEGLTYPNGYYYNEKNGITNKHNTYSGFYECFDVVLIESLPDDKLLSALKTLNPGVKFAMTPLRTLKVNRHPSTLIYPVGYYYNDKNGVTNKHNTCSGMYASYTVQIVLF